MNINKDAVLFTNLVAGKAGTYGAEYKLTLLDDGMTTAVTETPSMSGNVVTIPYKISGTNKKSVNQLSYLVTDKNYNAKNANILAYGKLEDVAAATLSGTTKLDLAAVVNKIGKAGIIPIDYFEDSLLLQKKSMWMILQRWVLMKVYTQIMQVSRHLFQSLLIHPMKI